MLDRYSYLSLHYSGSPFILKLSLAVDIACLSGSFLDFCVCVPCQLGNVFSLQVFLPTRKVLVPIFLFCFWL
jgi:hypothetical protein